jgi:hypothetical protein
MLTALAEQGVSPLPLGIILAKSMNSLNFTFLCREQKSVPRHKKDYAGTCFAAQVFRHKKKRREAIRHPWSKTTLPTALRLHCPRSPPSAVASSQLPHPNITQNLCHHFIPLVPGSIVRGLNTLGLPAAVFIVIIPSSSAQPSFVVEHGR